jgi:hypothetical protein
MTSEKITVIKNPIILVTCTAKLSQSLKHGMPGTNTLAYFDKVSMADTPVPIRTLKLRNIGPGEYLNGRPSKELQVPLVPPEVVWVKPVLALFCPYGATSK